MFALTRSVGVRKHLNASFSNVLKLSQRFLTDSTDRLVAVKSLQNPSDVLQFYVQNPDMDISSLEATLRNLSKSSSTKDGVLATVNDERFQRLIATVSGRLEVCDGRHLSMIANALAFFPAHSIEMKELARKIADVTCRRENAFTPRNLSTLAMSFAALGVRDLYVIDFLRLESKKLMQDFTPTDLYMMMDAFRRIGVFPRDFFDLIVEKMQDEVDRFTAHEMAETLKVLANVGLAKGFLIRRLANLARDSLHVLPPKTTLSVFHSLAKLRFLDKNTEFDFIQALSGHIDSFTVNEKSNFLMSLGLAGAESERDLALKLVSSYVESKEHKSLLAHTQVAWAICYYQMTEFSAELEAILKFIYSQNRTNNLNILKLLGEIQNSVKLEFPKLDPQVVTPPPIWSAGVADATLKEQERTDSSRLYNEVTLELDSCSRAGVQGVKLVIQRNQSAGPYFVDFLDEKSKIAIDIDTLSRAQSRDMKHRHLRMLGYKPAVLHYWQWRRCRTDADKTLLLQTVLAEAMKKSA
eukprot:GDKJ01057994.1.p1 GENE.GDKJ01057994.1~~GDKJ01057994.1.p1  ORF type:complete len:524 (-),score=143.90 GDKJ01057994.1:64-1635(-)